MGFPMVFHGFPMGFPMGFPFRKIAETPMARMATWRGLR